MAAFAGAGLPACVTLKELQPNCPIDWAPSFLDPVFYGFRDYPDSAVRVYYPSLDGSPAGASILLMCERFPLVLFIHGDCGGDPFAQWITLPAQLARAGYVVAVTAFGGVVATGDPSTTAPARQVHEWMRSTWEYRDRLLPPPHTAVVGHSRGGALAAQLATELPVTALAGLSAVLGDFPNPLAVMRSIHVPVLLLWNDIDDASIGANPDTGGLWQAVNAPKHGVAFHNGAHGDYLLRGSAVTCPQQTQCPLVHPVADDFVTAFLGKYLSPEFAFAAFTWVPESLILDVGHLPAPHANGFYAGSFLQGFQASMQVSSQPSGACFESVRWETSVSRGSTFLTARG
jgi:dienelactone hydrolase